MMSLKMLAMYTIACSLEYFTDIDSLPLPEIVKEKLKQKWKYFYFSFKSNKKNIKVLPDIESWLNQFNPTIPGLKQNFFIIQHPENINLLYDLPNPDNFELFHIITKYIDITHITMHSELKFLCIKCFFNIYKISLKDPIFFVKHKIYKGDKHVILEKTNFILDVLRNYDCWCNNCIVTPLFNVFTYDECAQNSNYHYNNNFFWDTSFIKRQLRSINDIL